MPPSYGDLTLGRLYPSIIQVDRKTSEGQWELAVNQFMCLYETNIAYGIYRCLLHAAPITDSGT